MKGRSCSNGPKQRICLKEFETVASPTELIESLLLNLLIAVHEGRKCIIFDVPGAFLQAETDEDKLMSFKLKGNKLVDVICEINPEHMSNVRHEKGIKVLYAKKIRITCGYIEASLQ